MRRLFEQEIDAGYPRTTISNDPHINSEVFCGGLWRNNPDALPASARNTSSRWLESKTKGSATWGFRDLEVHHAHTNSDLLGESRSKVETARAWRVGDGE